MTEEGRAVCLNCGLSLGCSRRAVTGADLCDACSYAEFCLGCRRGNEARAAAAAAAGLNAQSVWCWGCTLCSDCSERVHCRKLYKGVHPPEFHGRCEGCLGEQICGACCGCEDCCECAPRAAPAVCVWCNLRPSVPGADGCSPCRVLRGEEAPDDFVD